MIIWRPKGNRIEASDDIYPRGEKQGGLLVVLGYQRTAGLNGDGALK
jgi:hypothetical protein